MKEILTWSQLRISGAFLVFFFLFSGSGLVFGQDSLKPTQFEPIRLKRSSTRDPQTLATELTKNRSGEKEKFDAIFTWVVWNIEYDRHRYNSGKAYGDHLPVKKILQKQKGICTDYAHLMDTLCALAGIHNCTVGGYTKEVNFDLYDTLYFDNHAWNAVNLNGLWYLYDPTWCAGTVGYDYTRFGKWRKAKIDYFWGKTKLKELTLTTGKPKSKFCKEKNEKFLKTIEVRILPFFPRMMIHLLNLLPFRLKEKYNAVANTKYYLTNPEVFAVTHFPNDPNWSLTNRVSSVLEFSADSAYYDKSHLERVNVQRSGRVCISCDDFYFMDNLEKEKRIASESVVNNPENHLIPANFNLYFGQILLNEVLEEKDSLTKMNLMDSTRHYMDSCKVHLRKSRIANKKYYKFQMTKNKEKRKQLSDENKRYKKFFAELFSQTNKRKLKMRYLGTKAKNYDKRGGRAYDRFNESFKTATSPKKLKEEQKQKMVNDLESFRFRSDSLTNEINTLQNRFTENTGNLWGNVLTEIPKFDPIVNYFWYDMFCRETFQLDSYDKLTRDLREQIEAQHQLIDSTIRRNILMLTDTVYEEFVGMNELIRQRNALNVKIAKLMVNLQRAGVIEKSQTQQFRESVNVIMENEICSNSGNYQLLEATGKNFKVFLKLQKYLRRLILIDNRAEENRTKIVNRHILLNARRASAAIEGNAKIVNVILKTMIVHKAKFLSRY